MAKQSRCNRMTDYIPVIMFGLMFRNQLFLFSNRFNLIHANSITIIFGIHLRVVSKTLPAVATSLIILAIIYILIIFILVFGLDYFKSLFSSTFKMIFFYHSIFIGIKCLFIRVSGTDLILYIQAIVFSHIPK